MRALLLEQMGLQRRLNEWLLPRVGSVVVLGPRLVPIYAKTISAERIHVVPNFAPDAIFLPSVDIQRKFLTTEPLRVLYLSHLLPGKGYLELLGALTQLPTADLDRLRIDFAGGFESASDELAFRAAIAPFKQMRRMAMKWCLGPNHRSPAPFSAPSANPRSCAPSRYTITPQPRATIEPNRFVLDRSTSVQILGADAK
jgi:hypothetical protein